MDIEGLESNLGLTFTNRGLLQQALIHRSFLNEHGGSPLDSYERMEFLGDAVLELIVSAELYRSLPHIAEGELTKGRSSLVCRPSLAKAARRLSLGKYLALGKGESESGGQGRDSILEEAFESVVAAIYLDQGFDAAHGFVLMALEPELAEICRHGKPLDNPKSRLQELVQGLGCPTPKYRLVSTDGPDHLPVFTVEVLIGEEILGKGSGGKKSDAERAAAQVALDAYETNSGRLQMLGEYFSHPDALPEQQSRMPSDNLSQTQSNRDGSKEKLCCHSSNATETTSKRKPPTVSGGVGNAGSDESSVFSGPLTWMRRLGKNSKKS